MTSLGVQWLRLHTPSEGAPGSIHCRVTRSYMLWLKATWYKDSVQLNKYRCWRTNCNKEHQFVRYIVLICLPPSPFKGLKKRGRRPTMEGLSLISVGKPKFFLISLRVLVVPSCLILHNSMNCGMPGFPILHYLLEFTQSHVHWVSDAI